MMESNKKSPRIAEFILSTLLSNRELYRLGDYEEIFQHISENEGRRKAYWWYWLHTIRSIPELVKNKIYWSMAMFSNYLKIAFRNFTRYKLYSFINVFGLAISISACLMIYLWVQKELSYDKFHKNAQRIYRIERELFRENLYSRWPIVGGSYKQALIDDYPEIENAVRFWRRELSIKDHNGFVHRQGMYAVDNSIFDIFSFDLEEGDERTALSEPMTIVLTREKATNYFGTENVVGKSLTFEWQGEPVDFKITGILENIPVHSHIQFDMLVSLPSFKEYTDGFFPNWRSNYLYTYVLVKENVSRLDLEEKLKIFVEKRLDPHYGDLTHGGTINIHKVLKMHLFPITDIHLYPSVNWEMQAGGNIYSVYIFSTIALLILIIACLNFMNLSTARANKRAKEVSLRKTIGANVNQLRIQFIQESILLAILALVIAVVLIIIFIPVFNDLFNELLSVELLLQVQNVIIYIGISLAVGLFAGLYPAFYLTKFEPVGVLKSGMLSGGGKLSFRRNTVVIQFVISIALIIGMFTVYHQMKYIQNRSLGFDKENVVIVHVRSRNVAQNYKPFRNELMRNPQVVSVASSADLPSDRIYSNTNFRYRSEENTPFSMSLIEIGYDYIDAYKMGMLSGRNFSKAFSSDTVGAIILNESAVEKFGWTPETAIGKEVSYYRGVKKITGVMKNFNFKSVHTEIEPLVLILNPDYITHVSVRIKPGNVETILSSIEHEWQKMFPLEQFEFSFLDNRLNQLYESEKKMQNIFLMFSFLSLFVACLGLFGLAAYTAEERTKEIGIRKVLGASTPNILSLLLKEFIKWVVISTVIAWPIAYFIMTKWLQNFVYRINMEVWIFILPAFIALAISLLTVGFQSFKAAINNPIDSIKYE